MDWAQILVIILASFLALFILLGIILVIILIRVSRQIKAVAGSAERTVRAFEKTLVQARSLVSVPLLVKVATKYIKKRRAKGDTNVNEK